MEIESVLESKDIGFVRPRQTVEIKVDAFSFIKYGLIDGVVQSISNDAIEDENLGLLYSARTQLKKNTIQVGESLIALSPGMADRTELNAGKGKFIGFLLNPLKQYTQKF